MNYIDETKMLLDKELNMGSGYESLLELYALLVLTVGDRCTQQHVHNAWSIWQNNTSKDHRRLIPFNMLTRDIQEIDEPYRIAIVTVAKAVKNKQS